MDAEKRARRQSIRVIASELIMVVAVIVTVMILAFVVSGYWLGADFKIERQGLLQVYSSPTGADVEVDGNPSSWLQRTNTSKTLSAGEHHIVLTKDGYDSWSRTINIAEGLLYRLHYPRLFLKNRTHESAFDFSGNFASVSPDRNTMLLANNTTLWQTFNLDSDSAKLETLDLTKILPFSALTADSSSGIFDGKIESIKWATDNEHILLKVSDSTTSNWLVVNTKTPSSSINLTKEFNANFTEMEILDSSANNLLVVLNNNLHRIDVGAKQISGVLVPDVISFDYHDQDLVFLAKNSESSSSLSAADKSNQNTDSVKTSEPYFVGLQRLGDNQITILESSSDPEQVIMMKFYDDKYIATIGSNSINLYLKKDFEKKKTFELSFTPSEVKVGQNGEFVTMSTGNQIATLDMEAMSLTEWSVAGNSFGWLDGNMIYSVDNGKLQVYDFNGLNPRLLSDNVSSHFPVTITSDKYLYYFCDGALIREYLYEK